MPALPALPFVAKMLLNYVAPGVASIVNRIFFQGTQTSNSTALNTAAQTIANSWSTNIAPNTLPAVQLVGVSLEDLSTSASPSGLWTGSKPGTATAAATTPQNCFILRHEPNDRYRGGHSRIYMPGTPISNETTADANTWATAFGTSFATAYTTFLGNANSALATAGMGTVTACVPHYYKGTGQNWTSYGTAPHNWYKRHAIPVTAGNVLIDPFTVVSWNPTLGTQRRRAHQSV